MRFHDPTNCTIVLILDSIYKLSLERRLFDEEIKSIELPTGIYPD